MLDPKDTDYDAQIAALSARVYAYSRFVARDPEVADDMVQTAFLAFTRHRARIVTEALARAAPGDFAHAENQVYRYLRFWAFGHFTDLQREKKQTRLVTGRDELLELPDPIGVGQILDAKAAGELLESALLDELDAIDRHIIEGRFAGRTHQEIAAQLGITENASMIRLNRANKVLHQSERAQRADRSFAEARQSFYGGTADAGEPEAVELPLSRGDEPTCVIKLALANLAWHVDGHLRGSFAAPMDAPLPAITYAQAVLRGTPHEPEAFLVTEPFVLTWSDGNEGRVASFSAYLGPRPWARGPRVLSADRVQFAFAR